MLAAVAFRPPIILILAILLILALGAAAVVAIVYFVGRASQKKAGAPQPLPTAPPPSTAQPPDLVQQLRALVKLRDEGVITEEDFSAKKKALLRL
jgi:hypothetical protein